MSQAGIRFCRALFLLAGIATSAEARSLYWESLEVDANLDAAGRLHVTERQHMVFDGDWNGGERVFRLRAAEALALQSVRRIAPAGNPIELTRGNLSRVDHYSMLEGNKLRWRSRLPSDPPFRNTGIVYEIVYVLSGILRRNNDGFLISHDFAFTERPGIIKQFNLRFTLDPAWSTRAAFDGQIARSNLKPGAGVIVSLPLNHDGSVPVHAQDARARVHGAAPAAPGRKVYGPIKAPLALFLVFLFWRFMNYLRHERRNNRFLPLQDPDSIDAAWLEQHVFKYPPEKIGSLWDSSTGAAEVAAIIARLVQEKRLKSRVERRGFWIFKRNVLQLELLQPRTEFKGYERSLIKALFVSGDVTDTDIIRDHYKKKRLGFDPADKIRRWLPGTGKTSEQNRIALAGDWRLTAALISGCAACLLPVYQRDPGALFAFLVPAVLGPLLVFFGARALQNSIERPRRTLFNIVGCYLLYILLSGTLMALLESHNHHWPSTVMHAGALLLFAAVLNSLLNWAKTRESVEHVGEKKRLCAARRYFARELRRSSPRLQDHWYPYLIAFELNHDMDEWFRAHGESSSAHSGYSSISIPGAGWSGGGGSFGGGGATGAWTAAAAAMADGFAAPSSGGGGGSSGGGGGGGW